MLCRMLKQPLEQMGTSPRLSTGRGSSGELAGYTPGMGGSKDDDGKDAVKMEGVVKRKGKDIRNEGRGSQHGRVEGSHGTTHSVTLGPKRWTLFVRVPGSHFSPTR